MNDLRGRILHGFEESQRDAILEAVLYRMRVEGVSEAYRNHRPLPQCICLCYKSGDIDIPNGWTDACEAGECLCHDWGEV